ncbi:MAG: FeoB-associated Cys-rich membrane protein [Nibricoccus sp.]
MSPEIQTIAALAIVAVAAALLARSLLKKKKTPGCGGGYGCNALSSDAKKLRAKLGL